MRILLKLFTSMDIMYYYTLFSLDFDGVDINCFLNVQPSLISNYIIINCHIILKLFTDQ